ncbi:MAG: hypothetical protein CMO80_15630 [Verrucomicrobiales bacterium]|nr:hypothetical protein [Verrucomicrobiales bacterium]
MLGGMWLSGQGDLLVFRIGLNLSDSMRRVLPPAAFRQGLVLVAGASHSFARDSNANPEHYG